MQILANRLLLFDDLVRQIAQLDADYDMGDVEGRLFAGTRALATAGAGHADSGRGRLGNYGYLSGKTPASRGIIVSAADAAQLVLLTLAIVLILSSEDSTQLQTKALASGGADALSGPAQLDVTPEALQAALPEAYQLGASWGDLGPRLVAAGAIDLDRFVNLYEESGRPLTLAQKRILSKDSDDPITIDFENARFLLNFFWAVGLVNQNPILTEGPMMQASDGNIGRFASTGGWTLGSYPATELYASTPLIILTRSSRRACRKWRQTYTDLAATTHGFPRLQSRYGDAGSAGTAGQP